MDIRRRNFLQAGAVLSFAVMTGVLTPQEAFAAEAQWNKELFEATDNEGVFKALGANTPENSEKVKLVAPDIAENGAVVPIALSTDLENVTMMAFLIPENPNTMTGMFTIPEGTEANIATRVKMAKTSDIFGLVKAGDKYYLAHKEVKVTLGGCGG